jgi:hypothetical protein
MQGKLEDAAKVAIDNFRGNIKCFISHIECDQEGVIRKEVFEDFHFIGLFDLDSVSDK